MTIEGRALSVEQILWLFQQPLKYLQTRVFGALVIDTLRNGFTQLSIDSAVQNMVLGLVIIAAALFDVTRESMAAKA